jgi:AraC-like DNA-binding protein
MDGAPLATRRILRSADPDEVRDATGALTVGHDIAVHDRRGRIDGVVNGARLGRVNVVFVRYGAPVDVEAPATGDRLAMTIPLGPMRVAWPRSAPEVRTSGFALDGERPTLMTPDPAAGAIVIATDIVVLEDHLQVLAGSGVRRPLRFLGPDRGEPALPAAVTEETWRWALRQLDAVAEGQLVGAVRRHLEDVLLSSLLLGLSHTAADVLREEASPGCPPAIDRAREHLEAHFAEPLTTSGLAREVGVSVRYLQAGFRERFGATPMEVLRQVRLRHARRALLDEARSRQRTVADIALRSGFGHLGRFAGQYRQQFGESPSQTLHGGLM